MDVLHTLHDLMIDEIDDFDKRPPKKKNITHFLGEPQVEADARKERERRLSRRHSDDLSRSESFSESLGVSSRTTSAESAKYVSRIESCDFSSLH